MEHSARRLQRQHGGVRRHVAGVLAVGALATLAVVGCGHAPEDAATARTGATGNGASTSVAAQAAPAHGAPRELAVAYAYANHGQQMFALEPAAQRQGDPYPAPIRMNRAAAMRATTDGQMEVVLPDGTRYPVVFDRISQGPRGNMTWIGRVASPVGDLAAVLTYGRDGVFGVLPTPEGRVLQIKTRDGQAYIEPDPGMIPPGVDPEAPFPDVVVPARANPQAALAAGAVGAAPGKSAGAAVASPASSWSGMVASADKAISEITVLGVYTTNLAQQRGSASAAETEFVNSLEVSNQALIDSGVNARYKLVGLLETDYPGDVHNQIVLNDLRNNQLKDGLDIYDQRDSHGADLVALLRPFAAGDTNCGIAYLNGGGLGGTNTSAEFGYSVSACGAYTMAHELGHNLGSHHDRDTATENGELSYGAFEFSFGYRQSTSPAFATVMAYSQAGQSQLGFFSAPGNTLCLGVACGVANKSDNVRSMNLMVETISRFRDPPNTISVLDAKVVEPYTGVATLNFPVRLSTPAPAGGVRFDIATVNGGTATAGTDYVAKSVTGQVIPAGEREWTFQVEVLPDTLVEGDETIRVQLANVSGMTVFDSEAAGLIKDDDPRVKVSGALVFPEGEKGPDRLYVYAQPTFEGESEWHSLLVSAPAYQYEFNVARGAMVRLEAYMEESTPWLSAVATVGTVNRDTRYDLPVERAARLTGRIRWPAGQATPTAPINLIFWNALGDDYGRGQTANPPNYEYSVKVRRGVGVGVDAHDPPAPYVRQRVETFIHGDTVQDVVLAKLPTLSIAHQRVVEGAAGTSRTVQLSIMLTDFAPAGGVSFDLLTEDGTATGTDYLRESPSLTISEGNNSLGTSVVVLGDDLPEPDEYFRIVARNITGGAHMPTPGAVWIADDDKRAARHDFNGDGRSDLAWHHSGSGRAALWNGALYSAIRNLVTVKDTGWQIVGAGDFDRDGKADLFWRHARDGRNTIWRGGEYATQLRVDTVASAHWKVAGVGDFDGDGQADLLWRNHRTGANLIWRGGDYRAQVAVTGVTDINWQIAGVGDFDGDGRSDILWRNGRTGANTIWRQGDYRNQQRMVGVTDVAWKIVGVGDFDGDRRDDVLWRHERRGSNAVWHSGEYANTRSLTAVTSLDWQVATVGDYDGDGVADIAWRNRSTGANTVWRGGNYGAQMKITGVSDMKWRVVP